MKFIDILIDLCIALMMAFLVWIVTDMDGAGDALLAIGHFLYGLLPG
jgi:hypothetical protein